MYQLWSFSPPFLCWGTQTVFEDKMNVTFHPESTDQSRPEVNRFHFAFVFGHANQLLPLFGFKSYYQRAVAKSRSGDHAAAVDLFSMAIKSDPRNTAHYIGRAEALLKNECFQRALEDAREAVKYDGIGNILKITIYKVFFNQF